MKVIVTGLKDDVLHDDKVCRDFLQDVTVGKEYEILTDKVNGDYFIDDANEPNWGCTSNHGAYTFTVVVETEDVCTSITI